MNELNYQKARTIMINIDNLRENIESLNILKDKLSILSSNEHFTVGTSQYNAVTIKNNPHFLIAIDNSIIDTEKEITNLQEQFNLL